MELSSYFIPQWEREKLQSYGIISDTILLDSVGVLEEPNNMIFRALIWIPSKLTRLHHLNEWRFKLEIVGLNSWPNNRRSLNPKDRKIFKCSLSTLNLAIIIFAMSSTCSLCLFSLLIWRKEYSISGSRCKSPRLLLLRMHTYKETKNKTKRKIAPRLLTKLQSLISISPPQQH